VIDTRAVRTQSGDGRIEKKEAAVISTLLIGLTAIIVAVLGCALIAPTNWTVGDQEGTHDDAA
jgi:hypothetical protein